MEVVCPKCNAFYKIPDHKIPNQNATLTCKRCDHRIIVKPLFQSGSTLKASSDVAVQPAAPKAVPKAVQKHPREIEQCYPQVSAYDVRSYDMAEILTPTKKGAYKTRSNQHRLKLLDAVKPELDRLLESGERVARVAPATAYYPLELFLGNGWLTLLYNRYVLVATNKRLVAVNTNARMTKATHYLFQFPYEGIKKITKGLFGTSLTVSRKQARQRVFNAIKRPLAGAIQQWIAERIDPQRPVETVMVQYENLCPACFSPTAPNRSGCPACGVSFKSSRKAALRSLLLPGLGDFYLGHRALGVFELLGALLVWLFALSMFLSNEPGNAAIGLFLLVFVNGMDALLTLHMGKKGYALESHPEREPLVGTQAGVA